MAACIGAADPGAGVAALVLDAGQRDGALRVDGALVLALDIWVALQAGETGAGGSAAPLATFGINPTGRGPTGIDYFRPRRWG